MPGSEGKADASGASRKRSLSSAEFADRFKESFQTLWYIAVGMVRDRALAEDVVQEAGLVALGKLNQYEPGTNFNAWMGQMVRYVALNLGRRERRRRGAAIDQHDLEQFSAAPESVDSADAIRRSEDGTLHADQRHFDDEIMRALEEVGDIARACLLLRTIEGLDYAEISRLLEVPEGTAMSHVHRTRKFLRTRLSPASSERGAVA